MPSPSEPVPKRKYLTYRDIDLYINQIVAQMKTQEYNPDTILCIGRGGLIPASMITYRLVKHRLTFPELFSIYAWSYMSDGAMREELRINWPPKDRLDHLIKQGENVLIVDDLTDSGKTLTAFKGMFPAARTATLIHKEVSSFTPDFHGPADKHGHSYWYVFPWERQIKHRA
jgi:hypoxanthine phosphoribosyltransferase